MEYEDGVTWVIDDKAAASQADRAARPKGEVTAEMQAAAKRQKGIKAGWLADCTHFCQPGVPESWSEQLTDILDSMADKALTAAPGSGWGLVRGFLGVN